MTVKERYHKIDGWRGYCIPELAVLGASDTGEGSDSPCPTHDVVAELERFCAEVLVPNGIDSEEVCGESSNVFCAKRWVCVTNKADFEWAQKLATEWLETNSDTTHYVHDASE